LCRSGPSPPGSVVRSHTTPPYRTSAHPAVDTAAQLNELKSQIFGLTGETLNEQPDLAEKLSQACAALKQELLDPSSVSSLTGRLKRRVVLD